MSGFSFADPGIVSLTERGFSMAYAIPIMIVMANMLITKKINIFYHYNLYIGSLANV